MAVPTVPPVTLTVTRNPDPYPLLDKHLISVFLFVTSQPVVSKIFSGCRLLVYVTCNVGAAFVLSKNPKLVPVMIMSCPPAVDSCDEEVDTVTASTVTSGMSLTLILMFPSPLSTSDAVTSVLSNTFSFNV